MKETTQPPKDPKKKLWIGYAIILAIVILSNVFLFPALMQASVKSVNYSTFLQMLESKELATVQIEDQRIHALRVFEPVRPAVIRQAAAQGHWVFFYELRVIFFPCIIEHNSAPQRTSLRVLLVLVEINCIGVRKILMQLSGVFVVRENITVEVVAIDFRVSRFKISANLPVIFRYHFHHLFLFPLSGVSGSAGVASPLLSCCCIIPACSA